MFKRSLVAALLLATGFATYSSADHSWGNYHWARTNSFTLQADDNVSSAWDVYLDYAIADWSVSGVLDLVKGTAGTSPSTCTPTAGRIEVCSYAYGKGKRWLGLAQIWVSGSHITQATAKMNDTWFNTTTYNRPEWRRMVMCQELAHDFGLDHQDENFYNTNLGSCMDYTNNPLGPPPNVQPNAHDYDQMVLIYAHGDDTTTVASATLPRAMPPAMGQIDFDTPAQWGRLVRSNANGRVQEFELDFGGGHRVITHVFWADPQGDAR